MMTRPLAFAAAAAVLLLPVGCSALEDAMLAHILRNQHKLHTYQGVLVERGLVPEGELRSDVAFERPDKVLIRATSPAPYQGTTVLYDGSTLTLYWPQVGYAVKVDHLPTPDTAGERRLVEDSYRHGLALYDVDIRDMGRVADHPTVSLAYTEKRRSTTPLLFFNLSAYDKYSVFLSGDMHFAGGASYAFWYDRVAFNEPIDDATFHLDLPPSTIVTHWDLGGPDVPELQAREGSNFPLEIPAAPPRGLSRSRIVRVDGPVPAFTLVYRSDPYYLLLTEYKDLGIRLAAAEIGLPLAAGRHRGKLLIAPLSSTYTFRENGMVYQLSGNVALEDLVAFAASLAPRPAAAAASIE
ncbi:MAG TPA: hypothetical protein VMB50_14480 [Myxococcales bacterium]|nr:hypothetical protein [Myxococcales bacterium]